MDVFFFLLCHFVYEQLVCGLLKMRSNQFMEFNCWADYMACKSDRKCGKIIEGNLFSHDNSLIWGKKKYVPLPDYRHFIQIQYENRYVSPLAT